MNKTLLAGGAVIAALVLASTSAAHAQWRVCNRTPHALWAAIAWDTGNGYVSKGWFELGACGGCASFTGRPASRTVFVRATRHDDGSVAFSGSTRFCTRDPEVFEFTVQNSNPQVCTRSLGRLADYAELVLPPSDQPATITLRGPGLRGRVCID